MTPSKPVVPRFQLKRALDCKLDSAAATLTDPPEPSQSSATLPLGDRRFRTRSNVSGYFGKWTLQALRTTYAVH
ncbi:hypothetical protein [Pigmentiphaga litoralis]|uniref:Uncharacterized protein n=1 Tax=Pigmentiphaga litoralis TaxID=516702 RepID=A0A7Y9IZU5_9BURK|nr:hypothetical protein [Pigmentiphaga litoralis]NYE25979.1 hypothetical protein [Pigmentiphaga litoralis]NYE85099.1 hypothetical protein [Pigmentiphaga litoralis]